MRHLKSIVFVALLVFCEGCVSLLKAQATLTARSESNLVAVGQEFQVDFTLNANGSGFTPPSFDGFQVSGPAQSTSMNIINGSYSQSLTYSYYLVPKAEGTFTLGPASIKCGGKTLTSNSLTIKVFKPGPTTPSQNPNTSPAQPGNSSATAAVTGSNKNLFIKLIPSKSKVYVGEELTTSLKLYYRVSFEGNQAQEVPDYSGFYTEDIPQAPRTQGSTTREVVEGLQYNVDEFPQKVIFPQHPGKLKIGSFSAQFIVEQQVKTNNIFQQLFGATQRVPYNIKTDPVTIEVMPLPKTEKKFSGAVGEFTLKANLDRNKVKANEAINLTITVSGSGNLKLIDTLPLQFPSDFDHYDPKLSDHFTVSAAGVSGTRTFNYLIIPRHAGNYKIPAAEFTYFNPKKKEYVTLSTPEMNLEVSKGDNNTTTSVTMSGPVNKEDVKTLGSDIRYIHSGHEAYYRTDGFFLYSFPFFAGIIVPLLAFIGFIIARRRYVELHKDTVALKKRGATRMAKKRLKIAHQSIAANNKEVFYAELLNALNGYFSDKFSIALADLSRDTISANLMQRNVKPETLQMLNKTFDDCEFARYAPASVAGNLMEVYTSAVNLITLLEDEIS